MEEGPFRMPRSADRSSSSRPTPTSQPVEEPLPVVEEQKPVHRSKPLHHAAPKAKEGISKKLLIVIAAIVAAVIVIIVVVWSLLSSASAPATAIDSSKYQAVFFTNGQVYFGKLKAFNTEYMKLTDVFYLQTQTASTDAAASKNPQTTTSDGNDVKLIKLGNEIHGPQDEMIISKDQVLFYENLKSDGKVSDSIAKYKKS